VLKTLIILARIYAAKSDFVKATECTQLIKEIEEVLPPNVRDLDKDEKEEAILLVAQNDPNRE
jgi:hypothetical protein